MIKSYRKKATPVDLYELKGHLDGHIFCLDEDTEIFTLDRKYNKIVKNKIKELPSDFDVISYNFNKKKKELKKAHKIDTGSQECYEIETEDGRKIIATGNHRFFDKKGSEIFVKELKVGNELFGFQSISGNVGKTKANKLYNKEMGFRKGQESWMKGKTKEVLPQISRKGNKKYFGHEKSIQTRKKISELKTGVSRPDMLGDKNPAKKLEVRKKIKKWHRTHENPTTRPEVALKISISNKGRLIGEKNPSYGKVYPQNHGFSKKLGHIYRSNWEKVICLKLLKENIKYSYEPQYFPLSNGTTYTPDIRLSKNTFIEIRGRTFNKINKIKLFKKEYPDINLIMITSKENFKLYKFCNSLLEYRKFIKEKKVYEILQNKIN